MWIVSADWGLLKSNLFSFSTCFCSFTYNELQFPSLIQTQGGLWRLVSVWIKDTVACGQEELSACGSVSLGGNRKQAAVYGVTVLYAFDFTWHVDHWGHTGQTTQKALFNWELLIKCVHLSADCSLWNVCSTDKSLDLNYNPKRQSGKSTLILLSP